MENEKTRVEFTASTSDTQRLHDISPDGTVTGAVMAALKLMSDATEQVLQGRKIGSINPSTGEITRLTFLPLENAASHAKMYAPTNSDALFG